MTICNRQFDKSLMVCLTCDKYVACASEHDRKEAKMYDFLKGISWECTEIEIERSSPYAQSDMKFYVEGHLKPGTLIPGGEFSDIRRVIWEHLNGLAVSVAAPTPSIKNVIFNNPATIVFWGDGTKTVVKTQDGEAFDPEKGITMAFFKKMHGNKGSYFNEIKKWVEEYILDESSKPSEGVEVTFTFKDWTQAHRVTEEILRLKIRGDD